MMNILFVNIRGLGASPKCLALKDLFVSTTYRLILVQETMRDTLDTIAFFRRMLPSWYMAATEANGLSGGFAVLWDPRWINAVTFRCLGGILVVAKYRGYVDCFHILNVYALYKNRDSFWNLFFASGIWKIETLLIAGDLNCTLGPDEVWGKGKNSDPIGEKIREAMLHNNLVDICPNFLAPIWDNGRAGEAYIAKRLDRFILHGKLLEKHGIPSSLTLLVFISDHKPISLQWMEHNSRKSYPFKFNRYSLEDESFNCMVCDVWSANCPSMKISSTETLINKMRIRRSKLKDWQTQKKQKKSFELKKIDEELKAIAEGMSSHTIPWNSRPWIWELGKKEEEIIANGRNIMEAKTPSHSAKRR